MPNQDVVALTGTVQHVFAHRFTVEADGTVHLADLTPKGAERFPLSAGLPVTLKGERRPSEIKVTQIGTAGRESISIEHKKPQHQPAKPKPDHAADPATALAAVTAAGWTVKGEPRLKPKHLEVLARKGEGAWSELHVDYAGTVSKTKDADLAKSDVNPA